MNGVEFEKQECMRKMNQRNIVKHDVVNTSISIKKYMDLVCSDLINDLKMIESFYKINARELFKKILLKSYTLKLKYPRIRMDYKGRKIELYECKKYTSITIEKFKM